MTTVNKRVSTPQASVINGIDLGGTMAIGLREGYDNIIQTSPDGLQLAIVDREIQYCRGTVASQDWTHAIDLLTGTVGTYAFSQRKSGAAALTGYLDHVITAPVIHNLGLRFSKGGYSVANFDFECRAADETKGISDMHTITDSQAAPDYVSAARGGYRIQSCSHGALNVYHILSIDIQITLPLAKACNDSDVAYTTVDARLDGIQTAVSLTFQDSGIATSQNTAQQLTVASAADLEFRATQAQSATAKDVTVPDVIFTDVGIDDDASNQNGFATFRANGLITNNTTDLYDLSDILTIANAA